MLNYIFSCILWVFALYGFIDLLWNFWCQKAHRRIESNGIYVIVAAKNQEQQIEVFMRTFIHKLVYDKEPMVKSVLITDLASEDKTKAIMEKLSEDYHELKLADWDGINKILGMNHKNKSL